MSSNIDEVISTITPSLESTNDGILKILEYEMQNDLPEFINQLLLDSKMMIILSQIERTKEGKYEEADDVREKSIESTIAQRVTIERGIKPLEKKLNYQLDKMIRTYNKMLQEYEAKGNDDQQNASVNNDNDDSSEESEDELAYRPDASSLMSKASKKASSKPEEPIQEAYKPPKISAMAPPTREETKNKPSKKLQSMEEYLRENSDLPMEEKSIGVNIVNHGRGGVKTDSERRKEKELQTYEETNFVRLPSTMTKKDKYQKRKELNNTFGGEDWSMFNNSRQLSEGTSRKRKPNSVWDKVKRRK
ncbi:hypothetical protein CANTEDRAFT_133291 [Yamadazyma tenuis ATCC 10573]|uniref:Uncharacterized protein n=1 Tax=Candida tenuis (strain ATCC 10573 / BCRC 21748 / CBS 615 / JCM 9827 / NBRC 10315 / NRRL Y-1498 / VKM Y-70) TaxID=590646 RepID=G3AYJ6_CANTC|nr:uncharacterized protein CANTEDRAFT_133291 [Yamadazyma tenuis ATCC 10573]EGV65867.1 hypothetical protein CANTEDRAFT_133291 [Yamadazyma tenuis ATCC 10573]